MQHFADPSNPYEEVGGFVYKPELTGKGFKAIQFIIRVMCLDSHNEIKRAWEKLADAAMPERATKVFHDTTRISYQNTMGYIRKQIPAFDVPAYRATDPVSDARVWRFPCCCGWHRHALRSATWSI